MFHTNLFALASAVVVGVGFASSAAAASFTVKAQENSSTGGVGLATGLFYNVGDILKITVDPGDLWNAGALPRWSNANGLDGPDLIATGSDDSGQPAGTVIGSDIFGDWTQFGFTAPYGSLVGKIGSTYFKIGTNYNSAVADSGELELFYWDSFNSDNTEQIVATVSVPEPVSTLALLSITALAVGEILKKKKQST